MFSLTREEKAVLLFVSLAAFCGIAISYLQKSNILPDKVNLSEPVIAKDNSIININSAGIRDLQELPGIGPGLAERIVAYRRDNGYFKAVEDIKKVKGIGEGKFRSLKERIGIE